MRHRILEQRDRAFAAPKRNALEALRLVLVGKAPTMLLVLARHNADTHLRMTQQEIMHGRVAVDADQHEWRR
ncbi:MAG TPA: hypothetical protein VGH98_12185 [Gemmatimonadaceae bacterium]